MAIYNQITTYSPTTVFSSATKLTKASRVFVGFSTQNTDKTGETKLYDIDLINRDLTIAFYTRLGERVMRPDFGCQIFDWLMEPFTEHLRDKIVEEVIRVCESDIRLTVIDTKVYEYLNGIRVEMTLNYRPFDVINNFTLDFENRQGAYFNNSGAF